MPITYLRGDALSDGADLYVVTVNTQGTGVRSRGIAGAAYRKWPQVHTEYLRLCRDKELEPGDIRIVGGYPLNVALAVTKGDWRLPSKLVWVRQCLQKLQEHLIEAKPSHVVHMTKLGCGHGELRWEDVEVLYEDFLEDLRCDIRVFSL